MSVAVEIAKWVKDKPMILIRFDETFSESLNNSRQGFEHLTIVKPHSVFEDFKLPTICLMEIHDYPTTKCYLATATRRMPVSTFDSRLTIKKMRSIAASSLNEIGETITDKRMKQLFTKRDPGGGDFSFLSPKLSAQIIEVLSDDPDNQNALDTAFSLLPQLRRTPNINWAQEDAIQTAMAAFGIRKNELPEQITLKRGTSSGLGFIGAYLYEDNVVHADASRLPGFDIIASDVTGRATFQRGEERLVIYTANKLPLEAMFGVDLIYINETRGNVVMVQYKMLEEDKKENGKSDWIFRPNRQLRDEIARMSIPKFEGSFTDYRLNRNPFFFKFVRRKIVDRSPKSFLVSLDHLKKILANPKNKGSKGGLRISYDGLDGTYLREAGIISLIRAGYVGTHRSETEALTTIIDEAARGNRAVVLAWQMKVQGEKK
jgi:hypothetical protein